MDDSELQSARSTIISCVLALFVESVLYGVFAVAYGVSTWILLYKRSPQGLFSRDMILYIATTLMFALATTHLALDVYIAVRTMLTTGDNYISMSNIYEALNDWPSNPIGAAKFAFYVTQTPDRRRVYDLPCLCRVGPHVADHDSTTHPVGRGSSAWLCHSQPRTFGCYCYAVQSLCQRLVHPLCRTQCTLQRAHHETHPVAGDARHRVRHRPTIQERPTAGRRIRNPIRGNLLCCIHLVRRYVLPQPKHRFPCVPQPLPARHRYRLPAHRHSDQQERERGLRFGWFRYALFAGVGRAPEPSVRTAARDAHVGLSEWKPAPVELWIVLPRAHADDDAGRDRKAGKDVGSTMNMPPLPV